MKPVAYAIVICSGAILVSVGAVTVIDFDNDSLMLILATILLIGGIRFATEGRGWFWNYGKYPRSAARCLLRRLGHNFTAAVALLERWLNRYQSAT